MPKVGGTSVRRQRFVEWLCCSNPMADLVSQLNRDISKSVNNPCRQIISRENSAVERRKSSNAFGHFLIPLLKEAVQLAVPLMRRQCFPAADLLTYSSSTRFEKRSRANSLSSLKIFQSASDAHNQFSLVPNDVLGGVLCYPSLHQLPYKGSR